MSAQVHSAFFSHPVIVVFIDYVGKLECIYFEGRSASIPRSVNPLQLRKSTDIRLDPLPFNLTFTQRRILFSCRIADWDSYVSLPSYIG